MNIQLLADLAENGGLGTQWAIVLPDGSATSSACGVDSTGCAIEDDSLFAVYCAGKPLMVALVLRLIELGELSIDDRIEDLTRFKVHSTLAGLTVGDLLCHRAGLAHIEASDVLTVPRQFRREMLLARSTGLSATPCYTDEASWSLLQVLLEELTSTTIEECLDTLVTVPLGVENDVFLNCRSPSWQPKRQRLNGVARGGAQATALLWERSPSRLEDAAAGSSAIASALGLAKVLHWTATHVADLPHELSSSFGTDPVLHRTCGFRYGLMESLANHGFTQRHSAGSLGHSGLHGSTFAGFEPNVVTYVYHHALVDPSRSSAAGEAVAIERRRRVSDAIIRAAQSPEMFAR